VSIQFDDLRFTKESIEILLIGKKQDKQDRKRQDRQDLVKFCFNPAHPAACDPAYLVSLVHFFGLDSSRSSKSCFDEMWLKMSLKLRKS
jgi:hypothetical protein